MSSQKLLTPEETACLLGLKVTTLAVWRCCGRYDLPFAKIGRLIRYRPDDVQEFIARRIIDQTTTAQGGGPA